MNLVLSPHTDDGELGCGGTLVKWGNAKMVAFSTCDNSELASECYAACDVLGINDVFVGDFKRRVFEYNRQDILDKMILWRDLHNPDLVFIPSLNDIHQDHKVIADEAVRCFKCSILSYELPWNNTDFKPRFFVGLKEEHIRLKYEALSKYKSQLEKPYFQEDFIFGQAKMRGIQIGRPYAEAFEVVRWIN